MSCLVSHGTNPTAKDRPGLQQQSRSRGPQRGSSIRCFCCRRDSPCARLGSPQKSGPAQDDFDPSCRLRLLTIQEEHTAAVARDVVLRAPVACADRRYAELQRYTWHQCSTGTSSHGDCAQAALRIDVEQLGAVAAPHRLMPAACGEHRALATGNSPYRDLLASALVRNIRDPFTVGG